MLLKADDVGRLGRTKTGKIRLLNQKPSKTAARMILIRKIAAT